MIHVILYNFKEHLLIILIIFIICNFVNGYNSKIDRIILVKDRKNVLPKQTLYFQKGGHLSHTEIMSWENSGNVFKWGFCGGKNK